MEKKRLDYLDMVKGFGIFLVVLGHMEDIATSTRVWISSVHMPLFFIVTGIIMAVKCEPDRDFKECVQKRFRGIVIPYLWFSLSYFLIDIANCWIIKNIDFHTFLVDIISSLTFYGHSVLWFLPAIFLASVGFLFLKHKFPDKITCPLAFAIAIAAYVIKLGFEKVYAANADSLLITSLINIVYTIIRAFIAQSFVAGGYYAKKLFDKITLNKHVFLPGYNAVMNEKTGANFENNGSENSHFDDKNEKSEKNDRKHMIFERLLLLFIGAVLLAVNIPTAFLNECVDLRNILLNNVAIYYVSAFCGCFGIILVYKALPPIKPVIYYGKNSIIVMAAHVNYYFLYAGIRLAWVVDAHNKHAKHYVFVAVVVITVFALCTIVIEAINRFFPFVLGKKRIRK